LAGLLSPAGASLRKIMCVRVAASVFFDPLDKQRARSFVSLYVKYAFSLKHFLADGNCQLGAFWIVKDPLPVTTFGGSAL